MKIAQVAPLHESVPPKLYGGTERVVSYLTEELVKQGHDVTLFASGDSITSAHLIPVVDRALRLTQSDDHFAYHILLLEELSKRSHEYDIIHFHIDYLHFPLSRQLNITQLTTLHGRLDVPSLQAIYREYNDMPVVSISNHQRMPLPFANWLATVYNGVPEETYSFRPTAGTYLALLGRISPEKGIERAIEIAIRVGMELKIAAKIDKVDKDYFNDRIEPLLKHPLIEYIGEINEVEKNDFLGNAYAMLFPIDWPEPFGLAEDGINRTSQEQIRKAKKELQSLMPWLNFSVLQWATLNISRAEPKQKEGRRPATSFCYEEDNVITTWPTKLALAPNLANDVLKQLAEHNVTKSGECEMPEFSHALIADLPWQEEEKWSH